MPVNNGTVNVFEMQHKDILISVCENKSLLFWDSNNYSLNHTMNDICCDTGKHIIELPNGNIAMSSNMNACPIIIIDPVKYIKVIEIAIDKSVCSSLCELDAHSFIFVFNESIIQISSVDYTVIYQNNKEKLLSGNYRVLTIIV